MAGPVAFGQQWTLEPDTRVNITAPTGSIYLNDLTAWAFHAGATQPLAYDVTTDGGASWPTVNATTKTATNDVLAARLTVDALGADLVVLLQNDSKAILRSTDIFSLPTTSTWGEITLPGAGVGAPLGFECYGANVLVVGQQTGTVTSWMSTDGALTFGAAVTIGGAGATPFGYQTVAAISAAEWFVLDANSGKIYQSINTGASWALVKTITAGDVGLPTVGAIWAHSATRLLACWKGQVSVATFAAGVWTWVDKQNLTLNPPSTTSILQGGIAGFMSFGTLTGVEILGAATNYADAFNAATTRGAMFRSTDLGETWTLVNAVGGGLVTTNNPTAVTSIIARGGRGIIDIWNVGTTHRNTWNDPNPAATGSIPDSCGQTAIVDPCPEPEEA